MHWFVQSAPGSGLFFAVNSGLPFLVLLSFGLEFMELFPAKFSNANTPQVTSARDFFFDDINTAQVLGLYLIALQIKWQLGVGDFGCYDNNVKYPNDAAKQEEYELLPECITTADLFLAVCSTLFLALLTFSLIWRAKDVCAWVWLITIVTFVLKLRTDSNGLSPDSKEKDLAVHLFQLGPILATLIVVVFGIFPWLYSKCKEKRMRDCEDHFGTMLILQDCVLVMAMPAIWILGSLGYFFNVKGFKDNNSVLDACLHPFRFTVSYKRTKMLAEYDDKEGVAATEKEAIQKQVQEQVQVQSQVQLQEVQMQQVQVFSQQQQQLMVICPAGAVPGSQLQVPTAAGPMIVIIPQGCAPGQQFPVIVNVPITQMAMVPAAASPSRPALLGAQSSTGSGLLDFRNSTAA
mmetsp:Transcript_28251/g.53474  ORF Transcript_28251/g.53474 Transcript_28251/m.53474 type:complete len:405 (-) Transcript_28251:44-1258(-)